MKTKFPRRILLSTVFLLLTATSLVAQRNEWVNQVIIANGGKYEALPYTDYVTVQSYNPVTQVVNVFNTIYTQSVQDVVINGNIAYVAAEDSIVMYNIDTYQRLAAVADSGLSKLYFNAGRLVVTKQYPIKQFFVEILDATNLALLGFVQGISGDCGGAIISQDLLYVAVDSGWQGTRGRLAIIDPADNWHLLREVDLGTSAIGIWNLYSYNSHIYSVNKTPYGGNTGGISIYDIATGTFQNKDYGVQIGDGYGIWNNLLYLSIKDGLGTIDLGTDLIADTSIVTVPGHSGNLVIHSAAIDYVNSHLYMNIGNYTSNGIGIVTTLNGDSVTSYPTAINADAMAIDYRTPSSIDPDNTDLSISISPNPVSGILSVHLPGNGTITEVRIFDATGRMVVTTPVQDNSRTVKLDCSGLTSGIYLLSVQSGNKILSRKFIRR
jgi:hypothetical protein